MSALENITTETCPVCADSGPAGDPTQALGTVHWRIIRGWGRQTAYPVGFDCPNGHSVTAIGQLQRWFRVREL